MELFFDFLVGKPFDAKAKIETLRWSVWNALFFRILKIPGFVYVRMNFIL